MKALVAKGVLMIVAFGSIGAVALPAGAATAGSTSGGCGYNSDPTRDSGTTYAGVIYDISVTRDTFGLPIGATVSCKIQVNGVDAPGTTFSYSGYGVQAGADPISFEVPDVDPVKLCQRTVYADGTDTGWACQGGAELPFPPQQWIDAINFVVGVVNDIVAWDVNPYACPILAAHAGTYGPITIDAQGDVFINGIPDPLLLGLNGQLNDCSPA
ncbi:MAG: hypothetical protein QOC82_639 [Frankiaceae bacterium]|jgi:hypothetical protein|nr:hypothetical protein [Frankiaceae bacterium]